MLSLIFACESIAEILIFSNFFLWILIYAETHPCRVCVIVLLHWHRVQTTCLVCETDSFTIYLGALYGKKWLDPANSSRWRTLLCSSPLLGMRTGCCQKPWEDLLEQGGWRAVWGLFWVVFTGNVHLFLPNHFQDWKPEMNLKRHKVGWMSIRIISVATDMNFSKDFENGQKSLFLRIVLVFHYLWNIFWFCKL